MSLTDFQNTLTEKIKQTVKNNFDISLENIAAEIPPKTEFGDLAFPVAFELAKYLKQQTGEKQNPRAIAEKLKADLLEIEFVQEINIAGPGYLNIFYNRSGFLTAALENELLPNANNENGAKICIEHTSVNPNKAAHIGHVRNSVLGDTFVQILRADGKTVEVQNYIDNTGVQVADVVVGFIHLINLNLADIVSLADRLNDEGVSFDYYCWDLYAKVGVEYQTNEDLKEKRAEVLYLIEEGNNSTAKIAEFVATRNVQCILKTMERLSIRYDLLPRESEILHLNFWQKAFDLMKERNVIKFVEDGKMTGCWVMPFGEHEGNDDNEQDKILVRSNGTVTYTGKDIAYQMWKLGLLGMDFYYNKFSEYENGKQVWITTAKENNNEHPEFGSAETVYNVIDTRQSYPQEIVKQGVATIFPEKGEDASVHLSYEMVALSPSAAEELGFELSDEDKQKSFIEMSGRKGLGVKADDLINRLENNAFKEVFERNPEFTEAKQKQIAHEIAIGALRYFLSKFTKNTVIVFDFKEAMAFEGETGTYCQNATVRINSIFKKLDENALENAQKLIKENKEKIADIFSEKDGNDFWSVIILSFRLEETIKQAIENTEPAYLAKYTFNLAKSSNLFYQKHRIKDEPDKLKQALMICVAEIARKSLTTALETMGIKVPERM
ncbi:MAG: arginine--tRNA ligase [Acidobacteriota bacterium]|nr:arginine--tRNA ligase [Acidobacteriota bacterium]